MDGGEKRRLRAHVFGRVFTTNQMREAQQAAADRTAITAVIDFT